MCKYCECKIHPDFPSLGCNGADIVDAKYTSCNIQYDSGLMDTGSMQQVKMKDILKLYHFAHFVVEI